MWSSKSSSLKTSGEKFPPNYCSDLDSYLQDRYSEIRQLQQSLLGEVLLGTRNDNQQYEVIKRCSEDDYNQIEDRILEDIEMELEIMEKFCKSDFPYFVKFKHSICDESNLLTILEYVPNGDLCSIIKGNGGFSPLKARIYSSQLAYAIKRLNDNSPSVCHLDISLENILFDKTKNLIKLCDFGLSRKIKHKNEPFSASTNVRPGKKQYMSPEIYNKQDFFGDLSDIWSLGVVFFILVTGFPPFNKPCIYDKCFEYIFNKDIRVVLKEWRLLDKISSELIDLLNRIFVSQDKRINIKQLIKHPYILTCYKIKNKKKIRNKNKTSKKSNLIKSRKRRSSETSSYSSNTSSSDDTSSNTNSDDTKEDDNILKDEIKSNDSIDMFNNNNNNNTNNTNTNNKLINCNNILNNSNDLNIHEMFEELQIKSKN